MGGRMDQTDMGGGEVQGIGKGTVATSRNGESLRNTGNGEDRVTEYGVQGWDRCSHSKVEFEGMEVEKQYNVLIQQHATGQQEELINTNIKPKCTWWCQMSVMLFKKMP